MIYRPDEYTVSLGIPKTFVEALGLDEILPAFIEVRDWVSITSNKPVQRFQHLKGIFGEPFVEMTRNTSRVFTFSILQSSDQIRLFRELLRIQTFGFVGFIFSVFDNALDSNNVDKLRQRSVYPVAFIVDEPTEGWTLQGSTWDYQIQLVAGTTIYV